MRDGRRLLTELLTESDALPTYVTCRRAGEFDRDEGERTTSVSISLNSPHIHNADISQSAPVPQEPVKHTNLKGQFRILARTNPLNALLQLDTEYIRAEK